MKRRDMLKFSALAATGIFSLVSPAISATANITTVNADNLPASVIVVDGPTYNGDLSAALQNAPDGATLYIGNGDYNITGVWNNSRNTKKNILIIGSGMPELSSDRSRFVTGTGSVIQGAVKNQAKGFKLFNLGIDCGNYVSQNLYPSVNNGNIKYEDAIQITGVGSNANIGISDVKTLNSIGISSSPQTHSILLEQLEGVTLGYVECIGGFHGLTLKCQNLRGGHAHCYWQYGEAFILKSDSPSLCRSISMDSVTIGFADTSVWPLLITNGGVYDAHDNVGISDIHIGRFNVLYSAWGLVPAEGTTGSIAQITIGEFSAIQTYGNYYALEINEKCSNWTISSHQFSGVSGGIKVSPLAAVCGIGNGSVTGSSRSGYSFGGDTNYHGTLLSNGNGQYGVEYTGGRGLNVQLITAYNNGYGNFNSIPSVLATAPVNNWYQNQNFLATPIGHAVLVSGSFVRGSSSGESIIKVADGMAPSVEYPLSAIATNPNATSLASIFADVYISPAGYICCRNFADMGPGWILKINGTYLRS